MPWNDDNDHEMNDREGVEHAASLQQPQNNHANGPRPMNNESFEDLERQIEQIERQRQQENPSTNRQNVSLDSNEQNRAVGIASDQGGNDDEMFNAIVASLIDYTGN